VNIGITVDGVWQGFFTGWTPPTPSAEGLPHVDGGVIGGALMEHIDIAVAIGDRRDQDQWQLQVVIGIE
jgi:hypothetical protein